MKNTPRQALIKKVHVAKRELNMHDDDYRATLLKVTGKPSTKIMNVADLDAVMDEFKRLGWVEAAQYRRKQTSPAHVRMIYGLWLEIGALGALRDPSKAGLRAFVKRQTGVAAPEFLRNFAEAKPVIEALKKMAERARNRAKEVL